MQESKAPRKVRIWLRLLILAALVGGATWLLYETGVIRIFLHKDKLLHLLKSMRPWDVVVFILLQASQVIVAPIPGEVTGLAGGYLYGPFLGILWSTVGLTIGSYVAFALGRALGRPAVEKFVPQSTMARFDYLLKHKGAFIVFLLFLMLFVFPLRRIRFLLLLHPLCFFILYPSVFYSLSSFHSSARASTLTGT